MSIKKRILKNGIASVLNKLVRVAEQLLLVPFFISSWGAAYYGEWLTLTTIPTFLAFSDFGFGTAAANSFVLTYAKGEKPQANNIFKTGFYSVLFVMILLFLLGSIVIFSAEKFNIFDKLLINKNEAILSVSFLILARLMDFIYPFADSIFRAMQKANISMNLLTIRLTINLFAGLVLLMLGFGVVEFALSQLLISILFNMGFFYFGTRMLGENLLSKGKFILNDAKELAKTGFHYLLSPLWQAGYFQGTTLIIRYFLGAEAVTIFNTVRTLSRSLRQGLNILSASIFPELQFELGLGRMKSVINLMGFSLVFSTSLSILGVLFLAIFGLDLYQLWTKNQINLAYSVWLVFLSASIFNTIWTSTEILFYGMNKPEKINYYAVVITLISLFLTFVGAKFFGLLGSVLGAVSFEIILAFAIFPVFLKSMNIGFMQFIQTGYQMNLVQLNNYWVKGIKFIRK